MKRQIIIDGDIGRIPLTRGYVAIVDATDVHFVDGRNWCADQARRTVYARNNWWDKDQKRYRVDLLHRVILGITDPSIHVDHIDLDGLNNRRANLRECSSAENIRNSPMPRSNTSGFKGVCWHVRNKKWVATIRVSGPTRHLGCFDTPEEAYAAYCDAAHKFHGKFARVA